MLKRRDEGRGLVSGGSFLLGAAEFAMDVVFGGLGRPDLNLSLDFLEFSKSSFRSSTLSSRLWRSFFRARFSLLLSARSLSS